VAILAVLVRALDATLTQAIWLGTGSLLTGGRRTALFLVLNRLESRVTLLARVLRDLVVVVVLGLDLGTARDPAVLVDAERVGLGHVRERTERHEEQLEDRVGHTGGGGRRGRRGRLSGVETQNPAKQYVWVVVSRGRE
jgi:hypothetical protein